SRFLSVNFLRLSIKVFTIIVYSYNWSKPAINNLQLIIFILLFYMSPTTSKILNRFEAVFSVFSLIHFSGGVLPVFLIQGASEGDGIDITSFDLSLIAKISLLIYCCAFVLLVLRWKKVINVVTEGRFIWLFVIFVFLSFSWSIAPDKTFRFGVYGIGSTLVGLYLGTRYSLREQLKILTWTFATVVILSVIFAVALPKYGFMLSGIYPDALRGIYTHKNIFGIHIVLATVVFFLRAIDTKEGSWIFWLLLITSLALTVMCKSTTSLLNVILMLTLCLVYRIFRWRYEILVSTVLAVLITGIGAALYFFNFIGTDAFFEAIGKDPTLSSRTEIWKQVWEAIQLKPLLGYGSAAFWDGLEGPSKYVELAVRAKVAYAHNGFLDILLGIGFIGLGLFLISYMMTAIKSLILLRTTNSIETFWPLLFLTYLILTNVSEGTLAALDNIFWLLYSTITFSLIAAKKNQYLEPDLEFKKFQY
ncbi:MAG: O-antigen ligase family protein, partial [Xenococcus sp. (in: cyanobacteria)]